MQIDFSHQMSMSDRCAWLWAHACVRALSSASGFCVGTIYFRLDKIEFNVLAAGSLKFNTTQFPLRLLFASNFEFEIHELKFGFFFFYLLAIV